MPDLAAAGAALTRAAALLERLGRRVKHKSIDSVAAAYDSRLTRLAHAAGQGKVSAGDMARQHRALLREYSRGVYVEGLVAGDVDEDELDAQDERNIAEWLSGQLAHVADFAKAAADAKDSYLRMGIENRLDAWVRSLAALGGLGLMSARANTMATWKMALAVEEHCSTCHNLHNVRHRLKWFLDKGYIPREPGSTTLECGGWNCGCRLISDRGQQLV